MRFPSDWSTFDVDAPEDAVKGNGEAATPKAPSIGHPVPLQKIIDEHPRLRPPVIGGLLRRGEVMNLIAPPKQGKSWLVYGLGMAVADGFPWLDTFECTQGRVLLIDAELHRETLAHRIPLAAEAAGTSADYTDRFDVWSVRGIGVDLIQLGTVIPQIPPDTYCLVILDAWYRFLPTGVSENDNASVMALYNLIDGYAAHLNAAWVNVHHASKGDQSQKATTDVGSGAGSQSRAADAHLILRPHDDDEVAVLDAVVRSFPPVDRMAIRFDFPAWFLDREADPNAIRKNNDRARKEDKERHLNADRQAIVNAMHGLGKPETMTFIRNTARVGNPRFGYAWTSLLRDGTIAKSEEVAAKGNGRSYDVFAINLGGAET